MPLEDRLVKLLGVSPSVAHELASGERFYNTGMLEVIAQKIGYTVAMLFAGNGIAYCKPTSENLSEDEQALLAEWRQITPTTKNAFLFILDIYVGENSRFEQLEHTVKVRVLSSLRGIVELEGLEPGLVRMAKRALVSAIDYFLVGESELASAAPINTPLHVLAGRVLPGVEHIEGFI
jgi:hypothetical protein